MGKPSIMFPPTALALLAGLSVSAHHSPGYYFETAVVIVHADATVVSFTPANPHGRLVYSMPNDEGIYKEWIAELPANNMMRRFGVTANIISAGTRSL